MKTNETKIFFNPKIGIYTKNFFVNDSFSEIKNEISMSKARDRRFPSFLRLSGKDKTQATLYRVNLYGACKIT